MPGLILRPHGRLGNHILQWITAQTLAAAVPGLRLSNFDLPLWGLGAQGYAKRQPFLPAIRAQDSNLSLIAEMLRSGEMPLARLSCMVLQADAWGDPDRFRRLLPLGTAAVETAGPDEILLNVRADEILKARHPDYGPLPMGFYDTVLRTTGLRPVFMGQLGDDSYSAMLRDHFPQARFLPSQGAQGDFDAMRRASHIALSVSTFSWAAGWLSQAQSIHMPLIGFYNPSQRPDISLTPIADPRYHYYGFPPRRWAATAQQKTALLSLDPPPLLTTDQMVILHEAAQEMREKDQAKDMARLIREARISRPFVPLLDRLYRKA